MTARWIPLALALALTACDDAKDDTGPEGDADADTDSDTDTDCTATVVETTPEDGTVDWYGRDPIEVLFSDPPGAPVMTVTDAEGLEAPTSLAWTSEGLRAVLTPDPPLAADTAHTLHVEVCGATLDVGFTTGPYGDDLELDPADLVGRTYVIEFEEVTFTEPEGMGAILSAFGGINPLLVGVLAADAVEIELAAAEGRDLETGGFEQIMDGGYWEFPAADFTDQPFFTADVGNISLDYQGVALPIDDFHLEGTFAPDGTSFGGGKLSGTGDTRYVSEDYGDSPEFICDLAHAMGVDCLECSDGEPYCLHLLVEDIDAAEVPGMTLVAHD